MRVPSRGSRRVQRRTNRLEDRRRGSSTPGHALVKNRIGYLLFVSCVIILGWSNYQMYPDEYSEFLELAIESNETNAAIILDNATSLLKPLSSSLTPEAMFVDLSDMLPSLQGSCPDLPGYPAEWFHLRDLSLCKNLLKRASDRNECIIYNFGVGKRDPFLQYMSETKDLSCEIFAFDPFVRPEDIKTKLGPNVHFHEVGLWNGESDRVVGFNKTGLLLSLGEIQTKLGHGPNTSISLFRSDCEGCEYGWVKHAMDRDASFFQSVDQMFMEIHTVPIRFMSSISLTWQDGLPPTPLLEPVHHMLSQYFRVLKAAVNPGGPTDRNRVPDRLQQHGVLKYPCCREFNLINQALAAPPRSIEEEENACQMSNPKPPSLEGFADRFAARFHGATATCPKDETPRCIHGSCYCPGVLEEAAKKKKCLVYFFGNFQTSSDQKLLSQLSKSHPDCSIWAYDPRTSPDDPFLKTLGNVQFYSWGLYGGTGPRTVRTTSRESVNQTLPLVGELYTLAEIVLSWQKRVYAFTKANLPNPNPSELSLLRIDWSMASPCVWQTDLLEPSNAWWGKYMGSQSLQQLM